jgi:hypothetical protein
VFGAWNLFFRFFALGVSYTYVRNSFGVKSVSWFGHSFWDGLLSNCPARSGNLISASSAVNSQSVLFIQWFLCCYGLEGVPLSFLLQS